MEVHAEIEIFAVPSFFYDSIGEYIYIFDIY